MGASKSIRAIRHVYLQTLPRHGRFAAITTSASPGLFCTHDRKPASHRTNSVQRRRSLCTISREETTIYALSTAPGRAAIAIIRVSGPQCLAIYRGLCPGKPDPKPRYATLRTLYAPHTTSVPDSILDSGALVLYFPSPQTVTGEDVLEFHVHGGPAIVRAVLAAIPQATSSDQTTSRSNLSIRYAEPGEFTRRAFLNNRLDLTQVEALADALTATTEQQRRLSVRGTHSGLAKRYEHWRQQLLSARGELEALIDFSEDQDFEESPAVLCASVAEQVRGLLVLLRAHCSNAIRGEMLRNGIAISLLGAPNAGKSSLLNCVVGREAAIVSHEAGTTRDVVEVGLDLGGYFCRLGDTAGLRKAMGTTRIEVDARLHDVIGRIEKEGMRRAKERAVESDVVIVVLSFEPHGNGGVALHLDQEVIDTTAELVRTKDNVTVVINKTDLCPDPASLEEAVRQTQTSLPGLHRNRIHFTSCKNHSSQVSSSPDVDIKASSVPPAHVQSSDPSGIQYFLSNLIIHFDALTTAIAADSSGSSETTADPSIWQESLGATQRQRILLEECVKYLSDFLEEVEESGAETSANDGIGPLQQDSSQDDREIDVVLAAEHLRGAARCLAQITGKGAESGDVEEVLGVVFERFCVGK